MKTSTVLVGGIPPGTGGTAVVMSYIRNHAAVSPHPPLTLRFLPFISLQSIGEMLRARHPVGALKLSWQRIAAEVHKARSWDEITRAESLVLVHPQKLGYKAFLDYVEKRTNCTWLYLMDCSFFCIRSYNFMPGENTPCFRCLGGHFENIIRHGCTPHPIEDNNASLYVNRLMDFVSEGRVRLLAQHSFQAELARRHFGQHAVVRTIGVWAEDWTPRWTSEESARQASDKKYNVVFHGHDIHAKGSLWAMELATRCKEFTFFFPFNKDSAQSNCTFSETFWNTGLSDKVRSADVVLVPSLWSAPIEGSLIKSLVSAKAVAVVDNPTSFSSTIPEDLIVRLPRDIDGAASLLKKAINGNWAPDKPNLKKWLLALHQENRDFVDRLSRLA